MLNIENAADEIDASEVYRGRTPNNWQRWFKKSSLKNNTCNI